MNLNHLVCSNLSNVNQSTDMEFTNADDAYHQAELFTTLGFEAKVTPMGDMFVVSIEA